MNMACNCHEHECGHEHHHSHQHASKKEIILLFTKLGMSILFLLLGLFVRSGWTWLNILFYGISYLTIGYDVILESIKNIFKGEFFDENFLMTLATILAFVIKDLQKQSPL